MDNYNSRQDYFHTSNPNDFIFRGSYDHKQDYINLKNCEFEKGKYC